MIWVYLLVFFLGVLPGYVLLAPFVVEVNTTTGMYRARLHWLVSADFSWEDFSVVAVVRIGFWKTTIPLFGVEKKKRRISSSRKMFAVLRSFRVRTWLVVVDTGNHPLNGILFPVFYLLSLWIGKTFRISFCNENEIRLKFQNYLARMLWIYLRTKA